MATERVGRAVERRLVMAVVNAGSQEAAREAARRLGRGTGEKPRKAIKRFAMWHRCFFCGNEVKRGTKYPRHRRFTVEHLVPVSRGGPNRAPNTVTACARCNHAKGAMTLAEYRCTVPDVTVFVGELWHPDAARFALPAPDTTEET